MGKGISSHPADRVRFLGFVRDLPDLFRAADAHVLPSRYEGYSLVTREALSCGTPAFVAASAGIAERYPESLRHLLLPDPEDIGDLVARLRHWRGRLAAERGAVAAFAAELRGWTWDRMAERVAGLIAASA